MNSITVSSIFCRYNTFIRISGQQRGENYLDTAWWQVNSRDEVDTLKEEEIQIFTSQINRNVRCLSSEHNLIIVFGLILLFLNFSLRVKASKLMTFTPSTTIFGCKYGYSDLIFESIVLLMLVLRTVSVTFYHKNYNAVRLIYYAYFVLLLGSYLLVYNLKPFYNRVYSNLRTFQIIYLLTLTSVSIMVREFSFTWMRTELSSFGMVILALSFILKMNSNVSRERVETLAEKLSDSNHLSVHTVLRVYYRIVMLIDFKIKCQGSKKLKYLSYHKDTELLVNYLVKIHAKECKKLRCFCKKTTVDGEPIKNNSFFLVKFPDYYNKDDINIIINCLAILNEIFYKAFNLHKTNMRLFNTYVEYEINYLGNPYKAFTLISKKIEEEKIFKKKNYLTAELQILLDQLTTLAFVNLRRGDLTMTKNEIYRDKKDHRINQQSTKFLSVGDLHKYILFLKNLELLKVYVQRCTLLKDKFLKRLISKEKHLSQMFNTGKKFFLAKAKAYNLYDVMVDLTGSRYVPLYLIFGNFVFEICEDKKTGAEILNLSQRINDRYNLKEIFSKDESKSIQPSFQSFTRNSITKSPTAARTCING